jgi:hypothetical protein
MALEPKITKQSGLPGAPDSSAASAAATPAAASAAAKTNDAARVAFRYLDRPECTETFADTITGISFDGQTLRLEFAVSRMDETKPNAPLTGRRYPACRLVLPPAAAVDLMQKMQQVTAALVQAGYLKSAPRVAPEGAPDRKLS